MTQKPSGIGEAFGQAGSVGLVLAACIFIGLAIGVWLDRWLHTKPWLMLIFLMLGIVAGFYNVIKVLPSKNRKSE
jgi:ATP synthase protein I